MDFTQTAAAAVSQAIGVDLFTNESLPDPNEGKDPQVTERGRLGALKGGKARAKALSSKRKKTITLRPLKRVGIGRSWP